LIDHTMINAYATSAYIWRFI